MKPKEYIRKFNLQNGWEQSKSKPFLDELANELAATFELFDKPDDINAFDHSLDQISSKWNSISKKIPFGLPDKLWDFFFASRVAPLRESVCPTFTSQEKKKQAKYKRIEEEERQRQKEIDDYWHGVFEKENKQREEFFNKFSSFIMQALLGSSIPTSSFEYFGLPCSSSMDEVMKAFHEKMLKVHPDKGGTKELAVECIENKNKCMAYLNGK